MSEPDQSYFTPDPKSLEDGTESSLDSVPGDALADLLGNTGEEVGEPSRRDYGERYRYTGMLGEGGQGVVICAWDQLLERDVAIKALKAPFEPAREQHLEREAKFCGTLEHPNILPTYDLSRDETGSPFFVMKKIEGVSLEEMLKRSHAEGKGQIIRDTGEYSRRRLLNVIIQVCHAIAYAHSRGVYHLDLKPQNIQLGSFGEVYVLDWGFAAREDEQYRYVAGTPIYIAPERLGGSRPSACSDIYSIGVMLYRILTNKLPREVGQLTFREYREQIDELPIIPPRQRDSGIPADLEAIVMKAMANSPEDRYEGVKELAEDLERFFDLLPVTAYAEGPIGRAWRFVRRHRSATAAVLAIAVASSVIGLLGWRSHTVRQDLARMKEQQKQAKLLVSRRAVARIPLKKATDIVEKLKHKVDQAEKREQKMEILAPAFKLFARAIETNPDYADAYYERGKARYLVRDMKNALRDFEKAYSRDPSFIMAHYYAGRILADVYRDNHQAKWEFDSMKELDENNEYSELGQARIELSLSHYDKVLERCIRIEKLNPAIHDVWYLRGIVYGNKGTRQFDPGKALESYNTFLSRVRNNPSAYLNRGDIRLNHVLPQDVDGAIADYTAALAINPKYRWALNNRGYALYKFKNLPMEALKDIEAALRIEPKYIWAYMNKAAIFESQKKFAEAEEMYNWAHDLQPDDPSIWYRKGIFYFSRKRLREADEALTRSLSLSSSADKPIRLHRRGIIRMAMEKYEDALLDFSQSVELRKSGKIYPALMRWLVLTKLGRKSSPGDFGPGIDWDADKPWLARTGSFFLGEAKASEVQALVRKPESTPESRCEVYFYLGAHAWARGETERAADFFRKTIKTDVHLYMEYMLASILLERIVAVK